MKANIISRLGIFMFIVLSSIQAQAVTVSVTTLNFTGTGSINEAIETINMTSGPHIIDFFVTGTITATTLLPIIDEDVTINGYDIIIDGAGSNQIFSISSSSKVVINGITINNASAVVGSAISNRGELVLLDVTLANNRTTDRGGAIYNQGGDIVMSNCTLNNNQGGGSLSGGGAIYNSGAGSITANNCTFTGNFSFTQGGAITNLGFITLINATIASNSAFNGGGVEGGGIYNSGSLTMHNSIVYANSGGFFGMPFDIYNSGLFNQTSNLVGSCVGSCPGFSFSNDPLLSPLADNGGYTKTMKLLATSPAINPGTTNTSANTQDQRSYARDGNPDLGAYEADALPSGGSLTNDLTLDLKVHLGGTYNTGTNLMNNQLQAIIPLGDPYGQGRTTSTSVLAVNGFNAIVDWVLIELRDSNNPGTIVVETAALVQRDGDVVDTDGTSNVVFSSLSPGSYYVAIRHRNHLGVMGTAVINIP